MPLYPPAPSSGSSVLETEIDFGAGAYDGIFNLVDASCLTTSNVVSKLVIKSPSDGRSIDEILWESEVMEIAPQPKAGSIDFHVRNRLWGKFFGKFIINYLITY